MLQAFLSDPPFFLFLRVICSSHDDPLSSEWPDSCYRRNHSKVLVLSIPVITSSLSLCLIPTIAANLSVKDVLLVCETSFIVSGVVPVTLLPLPIDENSIVFSLFLGIGVDSVVFRSISSMLCSGVSSSTSTIVGIFCFMSFSSVVYSLLLLVFIILIEIYFFVGLGFVVTLL